MKNILILLSIVIASGLFGCQSKGGKKPSDIAPADTQTVADTGYTGIRRYFTRQMLTYEATFRNGVRQGKMTTYYPSGKVRQTFWYDKGMKEDTAVWFYEEGGIFRKTPFTRDSMNGIQTQYYRSGALRAKMNFVDGLRAPYLEEFNQDGKKITDYPAVIIKTKDNYATDGTYTINLILDRKNIKVSFYRGEFTDGVFNPKKVRKINNSETTGYLLLRKSPTPGQDWVGIISEISTSLGNKLLIYNKVPLPHNDLK